MQQWQAPQRVAAKVQLLVIKVQTYVLFALLSCLFSLHVDVSTLSGVKPPDLQKKRQTVSSLPTCCIQLFFTSDPFVNLSSSK